MFKKMLSAIGIGSVDIDLVLEKDTYAVGDTVSGKLVVKGGIADQEVNDIESVLNVYSEYVRGDSTVRVNEKVCGFTVPGFTIRSGETKEIPFSFQLPAELPVSKNTTHFKILTDLDVNNGADSYDTDRIFITPSGIVKNFLAGMELLGFQTKAEGYTGQNQLFSFKAVKKVGWQLDELEFHYRVQGSLQQLHGFFEVEKKTNNARIDDLDLNEKKGKFTFTRQELLSPEIAAETVRLFIDKHYKDLKA